MQTEGVAFVDPYLLGAPIKDPDNFFGRRELLQRVCERLSKRESTSLVGQRRSGKTSTLYYLMSAAAQHALGLDSQGLVFVYLNPQLGMREPEEFYTELVEALNEEVPSLALHSSGEITRRQVRAALKQLEPRRLVLLLDEFERLIGNERFPVDFFEFLRGLAGHHEVRFVTATLRRLPECYWGEWEGSPLYNIFPPPERLGSWTPQEFDEFLATTSKRCGLSIVTHKSSISSLAGRFPFYVQMACSFYLEVWRKRGEVTAEDHVRVERRFAEAASVHFDRIWRKHLSLEEKEALRALVEGQEPGDAAALRKLVQKGYVVDGRIFSRALREFVRCQGAPSRPRVRVSESEVPVKKGVWLDRRAGEVWVDGERCAPPLTDLMHKLLLYLYDNAVCICDKYELVENVWGGEYLKDVDDARIAKLVSRLRRRVEPDPKHPRYVKTVHGRGYKLAPAGED